MLAKVDPYLRPLFDALYDMLDAERLNAYMERGTIEVAPLAFMRGRTLNDSFIILDEAQNTSPEQMQMFLTRLGFGSKVVVTGDVTQIDLPREQASGPDPGAGHPRRRSTGSRSSSFGHEDVVRHKLVQRIVEAYKQHAEETGTQRRSSGVVEIEVDEPQRRARSTRRPRVELARARARARRGSTTASSGSRSSAPDEIRALKREHLGIDEATDVLVVPDRRPRRAAGRGAAPARRRRALPAGRRRGLAGAARPRRCSTSLGYDHGDEMEARERGAIAR